MRYYKVKPESDQIRKPRKGHDILVKDELYTDTEIKNHGFSKEFISAHFTIINHNPKQTYFAFGARFQNNLQS